MGQPSPQNASKGFSWTSILPQDLTIISLLVGIFCLLLLLALVYFILVGTYTWISMKYKEQRANNHDQEMPCPRGNQHLNNCSAAEEEEEDDALQASTSKGRNVNVKVHMETEKVSTIYCPRRSQPEGKEDEINELDSEEFEERLLPDNAKERPKCVKFQEKLPRHTCRMNQRSRVTRRKPQRRGKECRTWFKNTCNNYLKIVVCCFECSPPLLVTRSTSSYRAQDSVITDIALNSMLEPKSSWNSPTRYEQTQRTQNSVSDVALSSNLGPNSSLNSPTSYEPNQRVQDSVSHIALGSILRTNNSWSNPTRYVSTRL